MKNSFMISYHECHERIFCRFCSGRLYVQWTHEWILLVINYFYLNIESYRVDVKTYIYIYTLHTYYIDYILCLSLKLTHVWQQKAQHCAVEYLRFAGTDFNPRPPQLAKCYRETLKIGHEEPWFPIDFPLSQPIYDGFWWFHPHDTAVWPKGFDPLSLARCDRIAFLHKARQSECYNIYNQNFRAESLEHPTRCSRF